MSQLMTLERHVLEQQKKFPQASGSFTGLLHNIALAAKLISRETTRAGIAGIIGTTDTENVFGERQQKLDIFADDVIFRMTDHSGHLSAIVSEEHEGLLMIPEMYETGKYVLLHDPLDGSSNIDVNATIGTIFSIHRRFTKGRDATLEDVLQEGKRIVAAGYVIYGSSTMFVYTFGEGVFGFTLDPSLGEFILSHENIVIPDNPLYYSINQGNELYWTEGVRHLIKELQGLEGDSAPLGHRYIGALVSDFHRNLLKGGIYIYPANKNGHYKNGKIRLMHEAQAVAYIAASAGGYASDGIGDILDIRPVDLTQTVPLFIGNRHLVERAEQLIAEHDAEWRRDYVSYRHGIEL